MHSGNGDMTDLGERFVRCFDAAMDDAGLPTTLSSALHARLHALGRRRRPGLLADGRGRPAGAAMPRWGWDGLQS